MIRCKKMVDAKLSIVDLPVELLLKIFKLLDTKSRSKVAATCNSWKSLTEDFFRWHLNVTPLFDSSYKELMRTKRKFSKIQITGQVSFSALSKFLHQTDISAAVTGVTIKCATFRLIDFNKMLELFRNLEDLRLYSVTLCPDDDSNNESMKSPDLVHLKKLVFCVHTDERLLQSIAKAKLKTFVCREQTFTQIWNFLASQEDLKEIDVRRSSAESRFPDDAIKFSLQKLSFDFESALNFGILDLVWNQSYTIETVVLDRISAPLTYAMALSPLTNVTTLHIMPISVRNFPGNAFVLPKLQSVTKLKIYDGVDYGYQRASIEELTIKFIECVPNLKDLDLAVPYKLTYLETIVENLSKLKSIRMSVSLDTKLEHLKYPPVENLRIKRFAFGKFGTVHPPVSMIAARAVYSTVTSLSYEGYTNKELLNVIRIMFPMLKQLDVLKSNFEFEQRAGLGAGINICYREKDFFA